MKKILSLLVASALMVGCMVPAFALDASNQHDIDTTTGEGTSEVVVESAEATQLTVTVPVVLPASFDADGEATVATNAKIINKSYAPVKVDASVGITAATGWTAQASDYDFAKDNVGTKNFMIALNGNDSTASAANLDADDVVLDGINDTDTDEHAFTYDVKISGQKEALSNVKLADLTYTVAWAE